MLREAEAVADGIWQEVSGGEPFTREVVGGQLARAADSIGANIAEAFGRFHYGEKLQFLYYARGSLFETKYWLNRTLVRNLVSSDQVGDYVSHLTSLARQLNAFAGSLKAQRRSSAAKQKSVREISAEYVAGAEDGTPDSLVTGAELEWLQATEISDLQSLVKETLTQ